MAGGEEHARHGEDAIDALGAQLVQTVADDGGGEFQVTELHGILRQAFLQVSGQHGKFTHRVRVAAAVTTQHHTKFLAHVLPSECPAVRRKGPVGRQLRLGAAQGPPHRNVFQLLEKHCCPPL